MSRPTLEVADILRASGSSFLDRHGSHLAPQHRKVMDAIIRCRTATLGGHLDRCSGCGHEAISYNSCRNRHCPKCQGNARARWLAARSAELLPVPYFHIVFTLPHDLSALVLQNKRLLYDLLFRTSAATLLEVARDPKHLGADIGLLSCCIPGDRTSSIIPTCTAWCRAVGSLSTGLDGSPPHHASCCLSECSAASFVASSPPNSSSFCFRASCSFMARSRNSRRLNASSVSSASSSRRTG